MKYCKIIYVVHWRVSGGAKRIREAGGVGSPGGPAVGTGTPVTARGERSGRSALRRRQYDSTVEKRGSKLVTQPKRRVVDVTQATQHEDPWVKAARARGAGRNSDEVQRGWRPRYKIEVQYMRLRRHKDYENDTEGSSAYSEDGSSAEEQRLQPGAGKGGEAADGGGRRAVSTGRYREAVWRTRAEAGGDRSPMGM